MTTVPKEPLQPLLTLTELTLGFPSTIPGDSSFHKVVHNLSLELLKGEIIGLLGESGSGKTVSMKALFQVTSEAFVLNGGHIDFMGYSLTQMKERELQAFRGKRIAYIPQNASDALTPHQTIHQQFTEMAQIHHMSLQTVDFETALRRVGLDNPSLTLQLYPSQLSGGMAQRVMIAMTSLLSPELIIADEPTSAVDATLKVSILNLLKDIRDQQGTSLILITHDFDVIQSICDRAYVLFKGCLLEQASVDALMNQPLHPYTQELMACVSSLNAYASADTLTPSSNESSLPAEAIYSEDSAILSLKEICKSYWIDQGFWRSPREVKALHSINFEVPENSCFAIVGESGSGKSTLGQILAHLIEPDSGVLCFKGEPLSLSNQDSVLQQQFRKELQIVFQMASNPLDPLRTVRELLTDPIKLHRPLPKKDYHEACRRLLALVQLPETYLDRFPLQLSGGERQRLCIARALAVEPKCLILDEPVSALDVAVQEQIMSLLMSLKNTLNLTYLLITHDLKLARKYATHIGVMESGQLLEWGPTAKVIAAPEHLYTKQLLASASIL